MSHTLGIKIDGTRISDEDAKIIGLYIMGFGNPEVNQIIYLALPTIHNKASNLYNLFDTFKTPTALSALALHYGFDHYGCVNGIDVFTPQERERILAFKPLPLRQTCRLIITRQPVKQ